MTDNEITSENNSNIIVHMRIASSYFNKDEKTIKRVFIPKQFEPETKFEKEFSI